jgi:phage terminase Nu1 subunit (DNA packaging protein)
MPAPSSTKKGYVSRADLATKFNVTIQTIKNWEQAGMPVDHRDSGKTGTTWYNEQDVMDWYDETQNSDEDIDDAKLRKTKAEATLKELEVIKANNQSIDIKLSIQLYERQCSNIRAKLIALSSALAGAISDSSTYQERLEVTQEAIASILTELTIDKMSVKDWTKVIKDNDK